MRERRSMGEYPRRKCECEGSMLAAMDVMDERTRFRAHPQEEKVMASSFSNNNTTTTKRRKVDNSADEPLVLNFVENPASASTADSTMSSSSSSSLFVEQCGVKKNNSMRSADLKHKDYTAEIRRVNICQLSRETSSATSELSAEFMESSLSGTTTKKSSPVNSKRTTRPSEAEIEEFFSAAEKREQKRFLDKYNYDIVKDVPLEGRYHWIRLKP